MWLLQIVRVMKNTDSKKYVIKDLPYDVELALQRAAKDLTGGNQDAIIKAAIIDYLSRFGLLKSF